MHIFSVFKAMAACGGDGGGEASDKITVTGSGIGTAANLDGDYILQAGNANDTTGVWRCSARGKYLWYSTAASLWYIDSDQSSVFPADANASIDTTWPSGETASDPTTWATVTDSTGGYTFAYSAT